MINMGTITLNHLKVRIHVSKKNDATIGVVYLCHACPDPKPKGFKGPGRQLFQAMLRNGDETTTATLLKNLAQDLVDGNVLEPKLKETLHARWPWGPAAKSKPNVEANRGPKSSANGKANVNQDEVEEVEEDEDEYQEEEEEE